MKSGDKYKKNALELHGMPADPFFERIVLGSVITGKTELDAVRAELSTDDFSVEKNRLIWRAMCGLADSGEALDYHTVSEWLVRKGSIKPDCSGEVTIGYLLDLNENSPAVVDLENYLRQIKTAACRRRLMISLNGGINDLALTTDPEEVLEKMQALAAKAAEELQPRIEMQSPAEIKLAADGGINGYFAPYLRRNEIPSPWDSVNEIIGGFRPGQLIVIGGYTSSGKSAAAAQITQHAAQNGRGVAFFSFEMNTQDILYRMTCARASVNGHRFRTEALPRWQWDEFVKASAQIDELPIRINDRSGATVREVQAVLRKLRVSMPVDLVVIDYLQLMDTHSRHDNRALQVAEISRGLKLMAREMNLAVIGLSQLNRASQDGNPPSLKHLRESGSIEQDADIVMLLHPHREEQNYSGVRSQTVDVDLLVEKHRAGPTGKVTLLLQRGYSRFDETALVPSANGNGSH